MCLWVVREPGRGGGGRKNGVRRVWASVVFVLIVVFVCAGSESVFVVVRGTGELVGGGASSEFAGGWAGVIVVV